MYGMMGPRAADTAKEVAHHIMATNTHTHGVEMGGCAMAMVGAQAEAGVGAGLQSQSTWPTNHVTPSSESQ